MYNMLYALTQAKQCIHRDTFALTLAEQGHLWMNGLMKYEVTIHKYIGSVYTHRDTKLHIVHILLLHVSYMTTAVVNYNEYFTSQSRYMNMAFTRARSYEQHPPPKTDLHVNEHHRG
ncbi:hypothetical protein EMCRGX_G007850 [Ephydatia muelleri]